ncbi:MAG TPA: hypothetical protein PLH11_13105 [Gemmobacter sp.]|nr:hypothetical protein [Gemmobacter sp.]
MSRYASTGKPEAEGPPMLKTVALTLLSASLGMGAAVALTLSHGVQQNRQTTGQANEQASTQTPRQTTPRQTIPLQSTAPASQRQQQVAVLSPAISPDQPALPRLKPRPRPETRPYAHAPDTHGDETHTNAARSETAT